MPAGVTFAADPFVRAFDRMTELLAAEMTRLSGNQNLNELVELLQAGILHEELRRRFSPDAPTVWESERLPLVQRLGAYLAAMVHPHEGG